MRRKANDGDKEQQLVIADPMPEAVREARRRWAELLRRIFEIEPLACPRCGHEMRIIAFITEPMVIDRILEHLKRTADIRSRPRAPPGRWKSAATASSASA